MTSNADLKIQRIDTCREIAQWAARQRDSGARIGVVPTMGALHEGHLSLVRRCRQQCDQLVATIFVNPAQFGPQEDFQSYPRTMESDIQLLREADVDVVFAPSTDELYPASFSTYVQPPAVAKTLEGEFRPGHFQGVATIVLKLFQLIQPQVACFGQKDYQQSLVIKHMVRDLNVPVEIDVCSTVRESDGLAMSSRNRYLDTAQRKIALALSEALERAERLIRDGETDASAIQAEMTQLLIDRGVTSIDYAAICDADTLATLDRVRLPAVSLIAARVGTTRLIDNRLLLPKPIE